MNPEEIQITDWGRIFLGEVPGSFMLEVVIRIAFMYLVLMVSMRAMGKRMAGMLGRTEMAALVSLAASIGVSLQDPTKGLLPVVIIAAVVVTIQRFIAWRGTQSSDFEQKVMDDLDILVEDGCLNLEAMETTRVTQERMFAQLRHEGIFNLGKVKRVYLEANGSFSILQFPEERDGLSLIPNMDPELQESQPRAAEKLACTSCGKLMQKQSTTKSCDRCGKEDWSEAVHC
ncbi:DUF421 domain-containing protein [Rufibacter roseus]|uniref:DUF421 domain-containing protein n=1 Tax=Rufibacter roseus TaxID=1567108 RepID=A0ABW2DLI9_9BACT|nr:YetF domain-containing protein [Rufibacter roseus]